MHFLDLREISELIAAKKASPVEVTTLMLDRIAAHDPSLNSYAFVMRESAMAEAKTAEAEIAAGGDGAGRSTASRSRSRTSLDFWGADRCRHHGAEGQCSTRDATVVRRLRESGAVILGKLSMAEAAFGDHHPDLPAAINPWDAATWAGSSSAAPASPPPPASPTAPSAPTPAARSLPFGCQRSRRAEADMGPGERLGIEGCAGGTMDHVGPMARSVQDCSLLLRAIAGDDIDDPTTLVADVPDYLAQLTGDVRGLKIGVDPAFNAPCDALTAKALQAAADVFRELGASVVEVSIPDVTRIIDDWKAACAIDLALAHEKTFPSRRADYSRDIAEHLDLGLRRTGTDMRRILQEQARFSGRLQRKFAEVDVLLTPVTGVAAPSVERMREIGYGPEWKTLVMRGTCPFNVSGNPALAMPGGFTDRATPIGIQLVAAHLGEPILLRAGDAFQRVTDHHRRHPNPANASPA